MEESTPVWVGRYGSTQVPHIQFPERSKWMYTLTVHILGNPLINPPSSSFIYFLVSLLTRILLRTIANKTLLPGLKICGTQIYIYD